MRGCAKGRGDFEILNNFKYLLALKKQGIKPDLIILDPPRKGCDKSLLDTIKELSPKKIVYVSCDSATLARDLSILKEKGYETKKVIAVDMFPRTPHVECVALVFKKFV